MIPYKRHVVTLSYFPIVVNYWLLGCFWSIVWDLTYDGGRMKEAVCIFEVLYKLNYK